MAETKQLVLVVEGTAALAPDWPTIVSDYLEKVIRSFCGDKHTKNPDSPIAQLTLVIFNALGPSSYWSVQKGVWTKDVEVFMKWLRGIKFIGDDYCYAAIAEGLGEALMILPSVHGIDDEKNEGFQKHCILVAASNPYSESDALKVSNLFPKCLVSLSVISPTKVPKLREIYKAAKRKPYRNLDIKVKNRDFLVLISEDFREAVAALGRLKITELPSNRSPTKTIIDPALQDYIDNMINDFKMMTSSGQTEPATLPATSSTRTRNVVNDNMATDVGPLEILWEGDLSVEIRGQPLFLTRLQAYRNMTSSESLAINWPSTMQIDGFLPIEYFLENQRYTGKVDHLYFRDINDQHEFLELMKSNKLYAIIRKLPSQKLLLYVSDEPNYWHGILESKERDPNNNNTFKIMTSSGHAESATLPGTGSSSTGTTNVGPSQQTSVAFPLEPPNFVHYIWEGKLSGARLGLPACITMLQCYTSTKDSEALAKDWPSTMEIDSFITNEHIEDLIQNEYKGKVDYVFFGPIRKHDFLEELEQKKWSMVINLPSHRLVLSVLSTDKISHLFGVVIPQEMVMYNNTPQIQGQDDLGKDRKT